jgi:hypothetical protein
MRRPRNLLALTFGGLHLAFCVLFFLLYFSSTDSERSMAFVLFIPIDPWIVPLSKGIDLPEIAFAAVVTSFGTAQWWAIGWLIARVYKRLIKKEPTQPSAPTAPSGRGST